MSSGILIAAVLALVLFTSWVGRKKITDHAERTLPATPSVWTKTFAQSSAIDISPGRVIMAIIFIIACLVSYLNIPAGVGLFFLPGSFEHFEQYLMLSSSRINIQRGQGMWNFAGIWLADLAAHKFALSQDVKPVLNCQKFQIDLISLNWIDLNSITLLKTRFSAAAAHPSVTITTPTFSFFSNLH